MAALTITIYLFLNFFCQVQSILKNQKLRWEYAGKFYVFHDTKRSWEEANSICTEEGGRLPVVHTFVGNHFLSNLGKGVNQDPNFEVHSLHLGLKRNDDPTLPFFRYVDGDMLTSNTYLRNQRLPGNYAILDLRTEKWVVAEDPYAYFFCEYDTPCAAGVNGCDNDHMCRSTSIKPWGCSSFGLCDSTYDCTCRAGFEGDDCNIDIDECSSSPCQNGGSCTDHPGYYNCSCTNAYEGDQCQYKMGPCKSNPCQNEGTCDDFERDDFLCICTGTGFTGTYCETPDTSETGGQVDVGREKVSGGLIRPDQETIDEGGLLPPDRWADVDYALKNKDKNEPCDPNPCQYGGTCSSVGAGNDSLAEICACVEGFEGSLCDVDVDECAQDDVCGSDACINTVGSFKCDTGPGGAPGVDLGEFRAAVLSGGAYHFLSPGLFILLCFTLMNYFTFI